MAKQLRQLGRHIRTSLITKRACKHCSTQILAGHVGATHFSMIITLPTTSPPSQSTALLRIGNINLHDYLSHFKYENNAL